MLQQYVNGVAQEVYKVGELISDTTYNSLSDCNSGNDKPDVPISSLYQWVTVQNDYVCENGNKYTKQKQQVSFDEGISWNDTGETRTGSLIENNSVDCGYNPHNYANDYLTFEALEDGTFSFSLNSIQYSADNGTTWNTLSTGSSTPTITTGNKIMWKANEPTINELGGIGTFSSTGRFNVEGNIMSLVAGDNFQNVTTMNNLYQFAALFKTSKVVSAENLILPTNVKSGCYLNMFRSCSNLTSAPKLSAYGIASNCYNAMFAFCTSLTRAPELLYTNLVDKCYNSMFYGCSSLTYIKAMFTTTPSTAYTNNWVSGVAASGTFVKNANAFWTTTGVNGVPNGWTVQTASN